jgi:hypothetical protein
LPDGQAILHFKFGSERGEIRRPGRTLQVLKHGLGSGRWSLVQDDQTLIEAHKPSAFHNRFTIQAGEAAFVLERKSLMGRTFVLEQDGRPLGTIEPIHAFTRRATVDFDPSVDHHLQLFCFWLVALMWRRMDDD